MPTTQQLPLFNQRDAALAGLVPSLKASLNKAVKSWCDHHRLGRDALVDELNNQADEAGVALTAGNGRLSLSLLEKWLAPRDTSNIPGLIAINTICLVTGDTAPLAVMLSLHGCLIMGPEDRRLRDYGAALLEERRARRRKRRMEAEFD